MKNSAQRPEAPAVRTAYLVSRYPAVSHTFILREVLRLRALGVHAELASINPPDRAVEQMEADERDEHQRCHYIKAQGWRGALAAHLWSLATRPQAWWRGLLASLGLGHGARRLFGLFYFTEALMVGRWMESRRLDHLHVHFATAAAMVGVLVRTVFPSTLSLTVHGPDEFDDVPGNALAAKIAAADWIVCISQFARAQLMKHSPVQHWPKFQVCRLGVEAEDFSLAKQPSGRAQILCVGRLTPAKGQHLLLDAAANLRARGLDFSLRLIGDGPDRAALQEHATRLGAQDWVHFDGARTQSEVRRALAGSTIFALPSFAEGIPVVLMEAMAAGVPCVSTTVCGIPELIEHGQSGLLVPPGDGAALSAALAALLTDAEHGRRLAAQALARVRLDYRLDRNTESLARLFRAALLTPVANRSPSHDASPLAQRLA